MSCDIRESVGRLSSHLSLNRLAEGGEVWRVIFTWKRREIDNYARYDPQGPVLGGHTEHQEERLEMGTWWPSGWAIFESGGGAGRPVSLSPCHKGISFRKLSMTFLKGREGRKDSEGLRPSMRRDDATVPSNLVTLRKRLDRARGRTG